MASGTILISICLLLALEPPQCWAYKTDCKFYRYHGPPGEVIAKLERTLSADISFQFSRNAVSIMSGLVGAVPDADSTFNTFFGGIAGLTDPTADDFLKLETSVNSLIADIRQTVSDLKEYVGANVDQYDFQLKTQSLHSYLLEAANIYSLHGADAKKKSLWKLNIQLILNQPTFLPGNPNYETFEQLLPLTRTFVDLHMATLMELFMLTDYSNDFKEAIKSLSIMSYNWYVAAVAEIINRHSSSFPVPTLTVIDQKSSCTPFNHGPEHCRCSSVAGITYQQEWKNGAGCNDSITHEATDCAILVSDLHKAESALRHSLDVYIAHMSESLETYWRVEMGDAMEKLKQVGLEAGSTESQHITFLDAIQAASTDDLSPVYDNVREFTALFFGFVEDLVLSEGSDK